MILIFKLKTRNQDLSNFLISFFHEILIICKYDTFLITLHCTDVRVTG